MEKTSVGDLNYRLTFDKQIPTLSTAASSHFSSILTTSERSNGSLVDSVAIEETTSTSDVILTPVPTESVAPPASEGGEIDDDDLEDDGPINDERK